MNFRLPNNLGCFTDFAHCYTPISLIQSVIKSILFPHLPSSPLTSVPYCDAYLTLDGDQDVGNLSGDQPNQRAVHVEWPGAHGLDEALQNQS